jgi:hypothetical protein
VDVGTLGGYRSAITLLSGMDPSGSAKGSRDAPGGVEAPAIKEEVAGA